MSSPKKKPAPRKSLARICCEGYGTFGWEDQTAYAKRCWHDAAMAVANTLFRKHRQA